MKKFVFASLAVFATLAMTSCSVTKSTSSTLDVEQRFETLNTADLEVSNTRIEYVYFPDGPVKRGGTQSVKATAVKEALKANGGGDVLVAPQYEIKYGASGKVKYVRVVGYPATYKNFRSLSK